MKPNLLIALAISCASISPAWADVKTGVDAWSRGDFQTALKEWRPLAVSGDADAQFNLGQAYKLGRGVPADLNQAEGWYRKAALQGHMQAEDNYGLVMFQNGKRQEALPWIEKSSNRGDPRAQYILGTALFNGDMLTKDWIRAYALMTRASAAGLAPASSSLAQMDRYIPIDQRQKGLAMARDLELASQRPAVPSMPETQQPQRRPAPFADPVVRPVTLPPSQPAVVKAPAAVARPVTPAPKQPVAPPVAGVIPRSPAPITAPAPAPAPAPTPAPAPATVAAPVAGRGWRVQLGAFGSEDRARILFDDVAKKVPALNDLQPYLVKSGTVMRLQAGPLSSAAAADRLCVTVRAKGNSCLPIAP